MAGLITINHQPAKNDDQPEGFKGCLPLVNIQQTDGTSPCLSSVNQLFLWPWLKNSKPGWWFQTCFILHFIYGMSSFTLTNSYFSRWIKPPTRYGFIYGLYIYGFIYDWGILNNYHHYRLIFRWFHECHRKNHAAAQ